MRLKLLFVTGSAAAYIAWPALQSTAVIASDDSLPPPNAAYNGSGFHVFLDEHARLTCGSHGGFSASAQPPKNSRVPATVTYQATFEGELELDPPAWPTSATLTLRTAANMAEVITYVGRRGQTRTFSGEMAALDLRGGGMPDGVLVRESPSKRSMGEITITSLPRGRYQIEGYYDVWLEISLDGGESWSPAENAPRMTLGAIHVHTAP